MNRQPQVANIHKVEKITCMVGEVTTNSRKQNQWPFNQLPPVCLVESSGHSYEFLAFWLTDKIISMQHSSLTHIT